MNLSEINKLIGSDKTSLVLYGLEKWRLEFSQHPEPLLKCLESNDQKVIEKSLEIAAAIHKKLTISSVVKLLEKEDPVIRRLSVQVLEPSMGEAASTGLKQLFARETDPFVLASAVLAAARLKLGMDFIEPFLSHKDIRVRANATRAAGQTAEEKTREVLEPLLKDPALRVQNEAIKALARLIPHEELEKLVKKKLSDKELSVRASTAYIIGELPLQRRIIILSEALKDSDDRVKICAAKSLCQTKDPVGLRIVAETYLKMPEDSTARTILESFPNDSGSILLSAADRLGQPATAGLLTSRRVLLASGRCKPWEGFLPWIIMSARREEPEIRHQALSVIIERLSFFKSDVETLLEKADNCSHPKDAAMAAYIRWQTGQAKGLDRLKQMLFSLDRSQSWAAVEVFKLDSGLIAKQLLSEASAMGIPVSSPKPVHLPSDS